MTYGKQHSRPHVCAYLYQSQRNRTIHTKPNNFALSVEAIHIEEEDDTPMGVLCIDDFGMMLLARRAEERTHDDV